MKERELFDDYDMFAAPMPAFNIEGKTQVGSCVGFTLTVLLWVIMSGYTTSRLYFFAVSPKMSISSYTKTRPVNYV